MNLQAGRNIPPAHPTIRDSRWGGEDDLRILHTSDWHLGKTLEGRGRIEEQESFIDELCRMVDEEDIHIVLIAGDVFDTVNPPATAEELYYDALDRLAAGGRRAVVAIAGNHDNPERLCAAGPLAERHGISLLGFPGAHLPPSPASWYDRVRRVASGPSWLEVQVPGCSRSALIVALPYPSEARLGQALTGSLDETQVRDAYSDKVQRMLADLSGNYRPHTVNLAVSHLFVAGGLESESERPIQLGGACTVLPAALPPAQYVALGHLHRPQAVRNEPAPTRYSGSPLAYSFSEAGQAKSVVVIEAEPGLPASIREIHLSSGRPLVRWKATEGLTQVHHWLDEGRDPGAWIDLEVHVTSSITPDQTQALRRARPAIVNIRPIFPEMEAIAALEDRSSLPLDELFRRFYVRQRGGGLPSAELVKLFLELVTDESHEEKGSEAEGVSS